MPKLRWFGFSECESVEHNIYDDNIESRMDAQIVDRCGVGWSEV